LDTDGVAAAGIIAKAFAARQGFGSRLLNGADEKILGEIAMAKPILWFLLIL
jgi:hypothetical protein